MAATERESPPFEDRTMITLAKTTKRVDEMFKATETSNAEPEDHAAMAFELTKTLKAFNYDLKDWLNLKGTIEGGATVLWQLCNLLETFTKYLKAKEKQGETIDDRDKAIEALMRSAIESQEAWIKEEEEFKRRWDLYKDMVDKLTDPMTEAEPPETRAPEPQMMEVPSTSNGTSSKSKPIPNELKRKFSTILGDDDYDKLDMRVLHENVKAYVRHFEPDNPFLNRDYDDGDADDN
ncbi:hypothetical protein F5B22DRAFT_27535 [Xylaria bambusicola]|uniref:uncharacterized protein n=1 Tax=Xylaria bambusicola TaxID=326684 RepID=UPI0020084D69|nr:uncharacterized protein F5B22DRAFT_27535 [Xylaria bambusicola]KAI0528233.1 hypothetical protein F5B22DRAFT_27535 [Xylaria bambusicola]